ncbi:MAG: cobalamin B12-binding domain-containing protein [Candidatus Atabeyarchaeum deiterrae]
MSGARKKIRVLIAKPGLDGHDRGAKVVALALRDAGMEVIYTGIRQTPEKIVEAAIEEDVDVIGLSILSGTHKHYFKKVIDLLKKKGADDIAVFGGGIIPESDIPELKGMGADEVFGPGTPTSDIADYLNRKFGKKK